MNQYTKVWKDEFRGLLFYNFIKAYLNYTQKLTALDVGCRYGAFTFELAKRFEKVVGVDIKDKIIKEMNQKSQNIENLKFYKKDILRTDFEDNLFDLIIMEGVLEWVGCSNPRISPIDCQRQAIKECYRILKNNGILFIGIENKLFPHHILKDPHGFTPFTAILPKFISIPFYRKVRKGEYYGQNVLSYNGYKKLLKPIFKDHQILIPLPTYKYLLQVSSFNDKELRNKIRKVLDYKTVNKSYKIILSLLMRSTYFKLSKIFAKDFVIICRK